MRRRVWPPSSPSASSPSWSRSKTTPRSRSSRTAPGRLLDQHLRPPTGRQRPRPAAIVSAAWRAGRVAGLQRRGQPSLRPEAGALRRAGCGRRGRRAPPSSAARSAVQRPAAPPPTTATSNSAAGGYRRPPLGGSPRPARAARRPPLRGRAPRRRRPAARPRRRAARPPRPAARRPRPGPRSRRGGSSAAAIACSLRLALAACSSSSWRGAAAPRAASAAREALLLEVRFQRPDLGVGALARRPRRPRPPPAAGARPPRPARSRLLAARLGPVSSLIAGSIYYRGRRATSR